MSATASVTGYGQVTGPAIGATIAQTGPLPAGLYEVHCYVGVGGTTGSAEANNVQLTGGTPATTLMQNSQSGAVASSTPIRLFVRVPDGASLVISTIAASTGTAAYRALIVATRIGP